MMMSTHINAYFADVAEAEKKVLEAHAEWEAAKARLEDKKKEVGYVEAENEAPEAEPSESVPEEEPEPEDRKSKKHRK